jgi:hypothetical protein
MKNNKATLPSMICAGILAFSVATAHAGDFLKCQKASDPQRSKVSVQTEDLTPGALYTATIKSGNKFRRSTIAADPFGKVEYDFDSNRNDILAGATPIASNFISERVTAIVTDAMGVRVNAGSLVCEVI